MIHRVLALLGYLAASVDALLRPLLARFGIRISGVWLVALLLLLAAAVPTYFEAIRVSPQGVSIDQITDRSLSALTSWVRLDGRVVTVRDARSTTAGNSVTSVLIDAQGNGIMLNSKEPVDGRKNITGQAANSPGAGDILRGMAPPGLLDGVDVSPNGLVLVDDVPPPESTTPWWLIYALLILAAALIGGLLIGYPVFGPERPRSRQPLASGKTVRVGVDAELRRSGRTTTLGIGEARIGRGETPGELLLAIPEAVAAPAHEVPIRRDMWTSVTIGSLHTVGRAVPAFQVRSFALHGIVSFASSAERDQAAAVLNEPRDERLER